jgi:hypothetical protein
MSDVTFNTALLGSNRPSIVVALRAIARGLRQFGRDFAETVSLFGLIEGFCLLASMAFGSVVIAAAFGAGV